jgi:hypothetical protein
MILLIHDNDGYHKVAIAEQVIAGDVIPARTYTQEGKFLLVRAEQHTQYTDVCELQKLGYRLATASEQEEYVLSKKKKRLIQEKQDKGV